MKKLVSVLLTLAVVLGLSLAMSVPVAAQDPVDPPNTVASSTMIFQGTLTYDSATGAFTGEIPMVNESAESLGDGIAGFDVYAKWGACAYVSGYYGTGAFNCNGTDTAIIGSDHDAYSSGGPWGTWYDPDCADWDQYSLELTADHWYLRYTSTGESPMSGVMDWNAMYAAETDPGTVKNSTDPDDPLNRNATRYAAGSAQEWSWHCGWGEERVPLQFPGFDVTVSGSGPYTVTLTPAEATTTLLTANVPDIVAISVLPTSINFGDLLPGQTSDVKGINVTNIGTHTVTVSASLGASSALFVDNLQMTNNDGWTSGSWPSLITGLAMGEVDEVQTRLPVPSDYTPSGTETGLLIFEATAA